jgi:hypothetical protein
VAIVQFVNRLKSEGNKMAEFRALEALTAQTPTERQWVIRIAAELIVRDHMLLQPREPQLIARAAAITGAGQLCTDAPYYLARLSSGGWVRLAVDILITAQWAQENKWRF